MSLDVVYTKGFASGMLSLNITKASSQVKIATGNARSSDKTEDSPNMSLCVNSTNCSARKLRKMHPLNSQQLALKMQSVKEPDNSNAMYLFGNDFTQSRCQRLG